MKNGRPLISFFEQFTAFAVRENLLPKKLLATNLAHVLRFHPHSTTIIYENDFWWTQLMFNYFLLSYFSFDNSLLPLWSLFWTVQNIARHNTNKKFLFCFFKPARGRRKCRVEKIKKKKEKNKKRVKAKKKKKFIIHINNRHPSFITLKLEETKKHRSCCKNRSKELYQYKKCKFSIRFRLQDMIQNPGISFDSGTNSTDF